MTDCTGPQVPDEPTGTTGPTDADIEWIWAIARTVARVLGAKDAVVEDVEQITAAKLAERWQDPNVVAARGLGPRRWKSYVGTTARNAYFDQRRKERRRADRERRASGGPPSAPQRPGTERMTEHPPSDTERYLARVQAKDLIEELLEGRQRFVAARWFIDGHSITEIADELGLSTRTIRSDLQAIRGILRDVVIGDIRIADDAAIGESGTGTGTEPSGDPTASDPVRREPAPIRRRRAPPDGGPSGLPT